MRRFDCRPAAPPEPADLHIGAHGRIVDELASRLTADELRGLRVELWTLAQPWGLADHS